MVPACRTLVLTTLVPPPSIVWLSRPLNILITNCLCAKMGHDFHILSRLSAGTHCPVRSPITQRVGLRKLLWIPWIPLVHPLIHLSSPRSLFLKNICIFLLEITFPSLSHSTASGNYANDLVIWPRRQMAGDVNLWILNGVGPVFCVAHRDPPESVLGGQTPQGWVKVLKNAHARTHWRKWRLIKVKITRSH